jgi:protein-disulfide isomerase
MSLVVAVDEDDHIQGSLNAPIVLVEYGDYQCPHCALAYPIVKSLQRRFEDDVCVVFRNMPFSQAHPHAQLAAEAAEAAGAQGKFWEMHDALYENQPSLGQELIGYLARELELDIDRFNEELATHRFHDKVRRDFMGGARSGVNGTPTFFINGERYDGAVNEKALVSALAQGRESALISPTPAEKRRIFSRKEP